MGSISFEDLKRHYGHTLELVIYGDNHVESNIAIECVDCDEVLLDFDKEKPTEKEIK